jgi:hypothetical protein
MVPARFRENVLYVLLRDSARYERVLIFSGCEEMLGKVGLRVCGYPAGAHTPDDGDGRNQESETTEDRDGKEDIHAPVRRITSALDSCILFDERCVNLVLDMQARSMIFWAVTEFFTEAV